MGVCWIYWAVDFSVPLLLHDPRCCFMLAAAQKFVRVPELHLMIHTCLPRADTMDICVWQAELPKQPPQNLSILGPSLCKRLHRLRSSAVFMQLRDHSPALPCSKQNRKNIFDKSDNITSNIRIISDKSDSMSQHVPTFFVDLCKQQIFQVVPVKGQLCCSAMDAQPGQPGIYLRAFEGFRETGNNDSITGWQLLVIQQCCAFCVGPAVFARFEGVFFPAAKAEIYQGALLHIRVAAGGSVVFISTLVCWIFNIPDLHERPYLKLFKLRRSMMTKKILSKMLCALAYLAVWPPSHLLYVVLRLTCHRTSSWRNWLFPSICRYR